MGGGPAGEGVGVGAGGGVPAPGAVVRLPPRISPFITDGMSVRNSIFLTAERAIPPKIATIGFQIPRPWNFIFVMPLASSKSSVSIATFGRRPCPRTTSFPSATSKCMRVTRPSFASASIVRLRISLDLQRVLGNRGDAARHEIGLDPETAVLDEVGDTVEGFRNVRSRRDLGRAAGRRHGDRRRRAGGRRREGRRLLGDHRGRGQDQHEHRERAPHASEISHGTDAGSVACDILRAVTERVRAVYMTAPGRALETRDVDVPRAREGGAILETVASEVCGTDVHLHHGRLSGVPYPIIPGHVSVGRVLETRGPLADVEGRPIAEGALVTFYDVYGTCGACWHCLVAARRRAARSAASTASRRRRRTACSAAGPSGSRSFRA